MISLKHFLRKLSGWGLLIAGLIISIPVIVPGWGLPFIIAGLAILAPDYPWAKKLHAKALGLYRRIVAKMKLRKPDPGDKP